VRSGYDGTVLYCTGDGEQWFSAHQASCRAYSVHRLAHKLSALALVTQVPCRIAPVSLNHQTHTFACLYSPFSDACATFCPHISQEQPSVAFQEMGNLVHLRFVVRFA
jgi:hypothetical protein